jgi:hypothetical protein
MADNLPSAIEKYQQLKELFEVLDADLLDGAYNSDVTIWHEPDPEHRDRLLRFSKEGPQLIVPAYEKYAHQLDLQPHPGGLREYASRIDRPWASAFEPRQN